MVYLISKEQKHICFDLFAVKGFTKKTREILSAKKIYVYQHN